MLKVMRDSFQHLKWILVLVILVFIVGFVLIDTGLGTGTTGEPTAVAAKVNGESIAINDYNRAFYFATQQYRQMYQQGLTPEMMQQLGLPRRVMDNLIDETLLLQEARELGLDATKEEVRKKVLEIPVLNPNGKFVGTELYERYVRDNLGFASAADFEKGIARDLTLQKMENALMSSVVITPKSAEDEFRRRNESVQIKYVLLSADRVISGANVTPAEIEQFYKANSGRYAHPAQRHVKYLLADIATVRSQAKVTDAQLRQAYETKKEEFKTGEAVRASHILIKSEEGATPAEVEGARKRANDLVAQLRAGGDFSSLAKENSGDPSSAANGGDLGFFERGQMVGEFEQAAFTQPTDVVGDPVKTQYGFHIIKVTARRPSGYRPFEEVRAQLENSTITEQAKTQARDRINRAATTLRANAPKGDEDFRKLTDDVVSFNDALWFGKADPIEGLGRVPALNAWAFDAKVGDVGQVLETPRGFIVPYMVATREPGVSSLQEIRAKVENDARFAKARDLARQQLASAMTGASTLDAVAAKVQASPMDASVSREGFVNGLTGDVSQLVKTAFTSSVGQLGGPVVSDQGAVAFQVVEKKDFNPTEFQAQKEFLIDQMRRRAASTLRVSLLARLRKNADVTVNPRLLDPTAQPAAS